MTGIGTIILFVVFSISHGKSTNVQECFTDDIDFATKVANSTIVVYGKPTSKALDNDSDSTFHGSFQVDCILKGSIMPKNINIINAGRIKGRKFCQDLPVGRGHLITFLEPNPLHMNDSITYLPADFVEILYEGNTTDELLMNTCYLHQLLPLESSGLITKECPIVSTSPECVHAAMEIELTSIGFGLLPKSGDAYATDHIRSKSIGVDVDKSHGVKSINMSIILILLAVFVRFY